MLLVNQHLPDRNHILAQIMSLLKSILRKKKFLSKSMFKWRFLKKKFKCVFFCDEILLAGAAVSSFLNEDTAANTNNNKEFTGKSSLTSFCASYSVKKNEHHTN